MRLTDDPGDDWGPIWSPDGTRILFTSTRAGDTETGDTEIFAMNADGSDIRQLTDDEAVDWVAAEGFSPDGSQILSTGNPDGDREIFVMAADGSGVRQLTDNDTYEADPIWSPDGSRILFTSDRDGDYGLYSMRPDGTDVRQLTESGTGNFDPVWSPDGSRILFTSDRDGDLELFLMNADGSNERQLTDNDTADTDPAWAPDGTRAVFTAHPHPVPADGVATRFLASIILIDGGDNLPTVEPTNPNTNVWDPAWSPDGELILFVSDSDKNRFDLHVMRADGTGLRRLTAVNTDDSIGTWSPDGTRVLFASDHEGQYDIYTISISS